VRRHFYVEWPPSARDAVAALRIEAGRNPYDRGLTDLVGELSTRSEEFRSWWAATRGSTAPPQEMHPPSPASSSSPEKHSSSGDAGLTLITYTVEPTTASAEALQFLANWASHDASPTSSRVEARAAPTDVVGSWTSSTRKMPF
jgi:hypothetical protein